jgi:hypothetical protein
MNGFHSFQDFCSVYIRIFSYWVDPKNKYMFFRNVRIRLQIYMAQKPSRPDSDCILHCLIVTILYHPVSP